MSESKWIMEKKLHNVRLKLMGRKIQDFSLDSLTHLILKECDNEGLTFSWSFVEGACVLNIRNIHHDDWEINKRLYYNTPLFETYNVEAIQVKVLKNTFLLIKDARVLKDNEASSENITKKEKTIIISGDKPTPKHIRDALDMLKAKGVPDEEITPEAIRNHLPTGKMSTSQVMECNKYLKQMMEASP